jgi:argininosuccinate lyase
LIVRRERCRELARAGFATATDLADYLVRQGVAFRDAHEIVGRAVRLASEQGGDLADLSLEQLRAFSPKINADVYQFLTLEGSVAARKHIGGTAPEQVRAQIARLKKGDAPVR